MKKALKIAVVYIGLIIGAGFASGREVMEYFNLRSSTSFTGVLAASFLFIAIAYIILSKASEDGISDYDGYIDSIAGRASPAVKKFMLTYMFCGLFVMFAGSAALSDSVSILPGITGAVTMAAICFVVLSFDLRGIVTLNLILVPIMICGIVYVAVCSALFGDTVTFSVPEASGDKVLLSAVCYACYNTLTAGAVLVPLAGREKVGTIRAAAVGGGFVIGLLIMLVWTVQGINLEILWDSELPMLELAALCGKTSKRVYTAVLFMAICTTAVSYGFGLMSHFADKIKTVRQRMMFAGTICLAALPPAMYGFSNLVSQLYSIFGYIGMAWTVWIIIDRYAGLKGTRDKDMYLS